VDDLRKRIAAEAEIIIQETMPAKVRGAPRVAIGVMHLQSAGANWAVFAVGSGPMHAAQGDAT
jgi:hypothetical protein